MTKLLPVLVLFASFSAHAAQYCNNDQVTASAQELVRQTLKDGSAQIDPLDASEGNGGSSFSIPVTVHANGKTLHTSVLVDETCAVTGISPIK